MVKIVYVPCYMVMCAARGVHISRTQRCQGFLLLHLIVLCSSYCCVFIACPFVFFCFFFHGQVMMIFYCVKRVLITFMYELSVS